MMKERKKDNMSLPDELYQKISAEINNWPITRNLQNLPMQKNLK